MSFCREFSYQTEVWACPCHPSWHQDLLALKYTQTYIHWHQDYVTIIFSCKPVYATHRISGFPLPYLKAACFIYLLLHWVNSLSVQITGTGTAQHNGHTHYLTKSILVNFQVWTTTFNNFWLSSLQWMLLASMVEGESHQERATAYCDYVHFLQTWWACSPFRFVLSFQIHVVWFQITVIKIWNQNFLCVAICLCVAGTIQDTFE